MRLIPFMPILDLVLSESGTQHLQRESNGTVT